MADNQDVNQQIQKAADISAKMMQAAEKSTGKVRDASLTIAATYENLGNSLKKALEAEKKLAAAISEQVTLKKSIAELEKKGEKANKTELKNLKDKLNSAQQIVKESHVELKNAENITKQSKQTVENLTKQKGIWSEIKGHIGKSRAELIGYLGSTAAIIKGLQGLAQAAQDVADIQIQNGSFLGMSGNFAKDFAVGSKAAVEWSANISAAKVTLVGLGISAEEAGAAFKEFSVTTQDASRQRALTESTGALSRVLGVSLGDATEYVIEQTQKYNRTAESSAAVMFELYETTKKMNDGMGMTVLRGRDVAKLLFDISRESRAVAQDQKMMQQFISQNLVSLQSQGRNYKEALQSVSGYVKKMTVDAPDWAKILSARNLGNAIKKGFSESAGIGTEMEKELEQSSPGLVKRIKDLRAKVKSGSMDSLTADRTIQEWLSETRIGMNSMQEEVAKVVNRLGPQAATALKEMYGVSMSEAVDMVDMNKKWQEQSALAKQVTQAVGTDWDVIEKKIGGLNANERVMLKEKLTDAQREEFIRKRMLDREKAALKEAKDAQQASRDAEIAKIKENIAKAKEENNSEWLNLLNDQLKQLQDKNNEQLTGITDTISTQLKAVQEVLGAGWVKQLSEVISSPLVQIAGGVIALGALIVNSFKTNALLKQIEKNTGGGGAANAGGGLFDSPEAKNSRTGKAAGWATKQLQKGVAKGGVLGKVAKGALGTGKVLGKVLKPFAGKMGGVLGSLGIEALMNAPTIMGAFANGQNDFGMGGMKSLFANTIGKVGVGQAIGTGVGMFGGPLGALLGGAAGSAVDSWTDSWTGGWNLNKALGINPDTVGKENAVTNASIANPTSTANAATAGQSTTKTVGTPNAQASNTKGHLEQRNGGLDYLLNVRIPSDFVSANIGAMSGVMRA